MDRDQLVLTSLLLVRQIAVGIQRRLPPSFDLDDLVAAGYPALIAAAGQYDPEAHNGAPFAVYARHRVRGAILDEVRKSYADSTMSAIDGAPEPLVDPDLTWLERSALRRAVEELDPQKRFVMESYIAGIPDVQIGEQLGVTRWRISQIRGEATIRIREILGVT